MPEIIQGDLNAEGLRFAIVVSRFNNFISDRLLEGAIDCLHRHGASDEHIVIHRVYGSFELPPVTKRIAQSGKYDALICLGAVIRGSTPHFDFISSEVTKGLAQTALDTGVPVAFGVLTADTLEQAIERAGTKSGNKGWEASLSAIETANLLKKLPSD